jgi:hypothetical protein
MGREHSTNGAKRNIYIYRILVGKAEGRRAVRRHSHRWEENIEMDTGEID